MGDLSESPSASSTSCSASSSFVVARSVLSLSSLGGVAAVVWHGVLGDLDLLLFDIMKVDLVDQQAGHTLDSVSCV